MRKLVLLVPLSLLLVAVALSVDGSFYSALLDRGKNSFREGRYPQAVKELRIAAFGLLDSLSNYQTALVYLTLAQQRSGDTAGAATSVRKLLDAERVAPTTYRSLTLEAPVRTAFESFAATVLTPAELLALRGTADQRMPVVTETPRKESPPVRRTEPPTPTVDIEAQRRAAEAAEAERLRREREEAERVEAQRRQVQLEAERRQAQLEAERREAQLESERREAQLEARRREEQLEAQRREAERREQQRRDEDRREAARLETQRREAERREAQQREERREAERREVQRREAERREAERRQAERREPPRVEPLPSQLATRNPQVSATERRQLATANEALQRGNLDRAQEIYTQLLNSAKTSRAALLEVARGLYQVGDFRGSVSAFSRVGTLQQGEEQYHYYAAVSLFETGSFAAAKRQLACALPFIAMTDDVLRYQMKIQAAIE